MQTIRDRILHVPLAAKLLGANLVIVVVAAAVVPLRAQSPVSGADALAAVFIALVLAFAVSALLVRSALRPIDALQRVAERVARGEWYTHATTSRVADARIDQLVTTFNHLVDTVASDRNHINALIRRTLRSRELERASLSARLRETVAQRVAALSLQLSAAERAPDGPRRSIALHTARDLSSTILGEIGSLADAIYPGLLRELGLPAALAALAVRTGRRGRVVPTFVSTAAAEHLSPALLTAMYFVAEEAVHNAVAHAHAKNIRIELGKEGDSLRLQVIDDGRGFDVPAATQGGGGVGLFEARELLAGVHGRLDIESSPGHGTRVIATARLDQGDTC